jgi:hypothetical protein
MYTCQYLYFLAIISPLKVGAECKAMQTLLHHVLIRNLIARFVGLAPYICSRSQLYLPLSQVTTEPQLIIYSLLFKL